MICFCHMAKTAGTTLHYTFRQNYGTRYVEFLKIPELEDQVTLLRYLKRLHSDLKGVGGHHLRASAEFREVCPGIQFFTFLRDPVKRFFSWHSSKVVRGLMNDTVAARCAIKHQQDYQTKFLIGCRTGDSRDFTAGQSELEEAKRILERDYSFIGFAEHYDESIVMMQRFLGLQDIDMRYEQRNVRKSADHFKALSDEDRQAMQDANKLDNELYRFAHEVLWPAQVKRYGDALAADTDAFRKSIEGFKFGLINVLRYRVAKYGMYVPLAKLAQHNTKK